ncbi:MAG TPA: hypothetical protein VFW42_08050 [Fluviicoccus sp.]|nr:hypothetical protein [Fluviicoccus sp.]
MPDNKNLLAAAIAAALATLVSGCVSNAAKSGGGESSAPVAAAVQAAVAPAPATAMPANSSGISVPVTAVNPEDLLDYNKTIVVPTAYVKFLVEGKVGVSKQGSALSTLGGGSANSVKASAKYHLNGMNKALAQSIAKKAYDDFVAQMRAAGYTVLTWNDIKGRDYLQGIALAKADAKWGLPVESPVGSSDTLLVAAPSDEQQIKIGFTGPFSEFISLGKPKIKDATIIIPTYTIVAPQIWGETGASYSTISAGIQTAPGMNLQAASATWMGKPKTRMMRGIPGVASKAPVLNITANAGTLSKTDTTSNAANALSKGLSLLSGAGSITSNSADYTFTVDATAYSNGALKGISAFNAEVAKVARGAK